MHDPEDEFSCEGCNSFNGRYCFFHLRTMKEWELCPDWREVKHEE